MPPSRTGRACKRMRWAVMGSTLSGQFGGASVSLQSEVRRDQLGRTVPPSAISFQTKANTLTL
jgi:hypothetical protein